MLLAPERLSVAGIGPSEELFREAVGASTRVCPRSRRAARAGPGATLRENRHSAVHRRRRSRVPTRGWGVGGRPLRDAPESASSDTAGRSGGARAGARARGHEVEASRGSGRVRRGGRLHAARRCRRNVAALRSGGVPCVIGTTRLRPGGSMPAREDQRLPCFYAPNFALGAVLMMRFAEEAAQLPAAGGDRRAARTSTKRRRAVRHGEGDRRAAAAATPPIHSVRLPGLVAHQEVLFGGDGQLLTIRHDTFSREAFVPGRPARARAAPRSRRG